MQITTEDQKLIQKFYRDNLKRFGSQDPGAINWNSTYSQFIRFKVLADVDNLDGESVLDYGCGLGDFYSYLKMRFKKFSYLGVDIVPELIETALKKYAAAEFKLIESGEIPEGKYDYIFSSGVFTYKLEDAENKYKALMQKLYNKAKKGFCLNLLKKGMHLETDIHLTWDPEKFIEFGETFAKEVKLVEGYLDYDFTVYLLH